ncbi:MAG TPA: DUF5995 family protein [Acidimicrobiia bacterium]|nr:DUF5995 family protein [Acidimicrobiia bacterium]
MADPRHCPALRAGAATSVAGVVDRLTEIRDGTATIDPEGGIAQFSDLYRTITQNVEAKIEAGGFFDDDEFLGRLVTAFANRYFDALRAWADRGGTLPGAWRMLFEVPSNGEITAVQLAAAGVNAHINLDLAVALVDTGRERGDPALETGTHRTDYEKVNQVFAEEMDGLLRRLMDQRAESGEETEHLSVFGRIMTRVVTTARHFAWEDAECLWPLPRRSDEWAEKEHHMDAVACRLGHGILIDVLG